MATPTVLRFARLLVAAALVARLAAADTAYGFHQDLVYDGDDARRGAAIAAVAGIGATVSRSTLVWSQVEPSRGARDWSRVDAVVAALAARGVEPLFVLIGSPAWANGSGDPFVVPSDPAAFARWVQDDAAFVGAAVARYRGRVRKWEIGNEVNEPYFWKPAPDVAKFDAWYRALRSAILAADPGAEIAMGGFTGLYASVAIPARDFIDALIARGTPFDRISIHPYSDHAPDVDVPWQGNFSDVQRIHDQLLARGRDVPLWITEWGWPTDRVAPIDQAAWLATSLGWIRDRYPFVAVATVFVDYDRPPEYFHGVFDASLARKPAADAFAGFTADLARRASAGAGGLTAQYWSGQARTFVGAPTLTRVDPVVDFDWGTGSPAPSISVDGFTARWTGRVQAPSDGAWTFAVTSDDGARLWIDGTLLVDRWIDQSPTRAAGAVTLVGGRWYDLRLDMYERTGGAVARLAWSGPGQAEAIVRRARLSPADASPSLTWRDVGAVAVAGSATASSGTWTVRGSGADIWDAADGFAFAAQRLDGDGEIVARVVAQTATDPWAKAGVMIRETMDPGSRHAFCALTPGNGIAFQRRSDPGGPSAHLAGAALGAPAWVKLTRVGDRFTAAQSSDGQTWRVIGSRTIAMGATTWVGLAVTSHHDGVVSTAVFDQVVVTAAPVGPS